LVRDVFEIMLTREEFQVIYDQGPDAVYELFVSMQTVIETLTARVKQLEDRLGKDSHNSSKPPSSDGLARKPKPTSLRGKSGRRSGGQPGHPGRTLEFAEKPDDTVIHSPSVCQECGASLAEAPIVETRRHQVFDLPPLELSVVEHQAHTRCCPDCGHKNRAEFPVHAEHRVQYGPRIKGLTTYLMHFQLLPFERVRDLMQDLFGASVCEGTLQNTTQQAYHALADVETCIYKALCDSDIVCFDETGARIAKKLHWLHVASTTLLTFYACDPQRGRIALDAIGILAQLRGRAIHDGWAAYAEFDCLHGLCNAHHLRELTAVEEQYHQAWATQMRELLCQIKRAVVRAKECGHSRLDPLEEGKFASRYTDILTTGYAANPPPESTGKKGRPKQGPVRSLLLRLDQRRAAVLAFMYDFKVPFDNNQAERDLRMMKVKQKVSGCFRSDEGAKAFCRIRGYISTLRKQGQSIMQALQQVFAGAPVMPVLCAE
jgi:transposase